MYDVVVAAADAAAAAIIVIVLLLVDSSRHRCGVQGTGRERLFNSEVCVSCSCSCVRVFGK